MNIQWLRFADFIVSGVSDFFCFSINTSRRREKLEFMHALFLENEEEMSEKKYRAMFLNRNEVYMPNYSYFWAHGKSAKNREDQLRAL